MAHYYEVSFNGILGHTLVYAKDVVDAVLKAEKAASERGWTNAGAYIVEISRTDITQIIE